MRLTENEKYDLEIVKHRLVKLERLTNVKEIKIEMKKQIDTLTKVINKLKIKK